MQMLRLVSVLLREVRAAVDDRLYRTTIFVLPLVMILFFAVMFYGGSVENLPIAVVDKDGSELSRKLTNMLDATPGVDVCCQPRSMIEAEEFMLNGQVVGIFLIPDAFEAHILGGVPVAVECYVSGANISTSGVVVRAVQQVVNTYSAGIALDKLQMQGVGYTQAMVDIIPVNYHEHIVSNPNLNYGYYLAPLFIFLGLLIFTTITTVYSFGRELRYALVDDWLATASNSFAAAVLGKLLFIVVVMTLYMQLAYFIIFEVMGMTCQGSYLTLSLASVLFIIASASVALAIFSAVANLRLALSLGGGFAVMSFTFSGITFPTMAMYGVASLLSHIFPLSYFSRIFIAVATLNVPFRYWYGDVVILMLFGVLVALVWRRLKCITLDNRYLSHD
jgi:ABC-2 type transport system permease protein